jgi:hypothetical protein
MNDGCLQIGYGFSHMNDECLYIGYGFSHVWMMNFYILGMHWEEALKQHLLW